MEIKKKYKRDARAENAFDIELFLDKETNKVSYLDKNRIPKEIAPASEGGGGSGDYLTTTVTITAAELLTTAANDTLKELIPAPGAGKYIAINRFVGKFKNATIAYDNSPSIEFVTNVGSFGAFDISSLGTTENFVIYKGNGLASGINANIYAKYKSSAVTPTVGDGEVIVEIEYKILDF
jgi:hypothetical protein